MDLHVIYQEGRKQEHNESISVLGLVLVLCIYLLTQESEQYSEA